MEISYKQGLLYSYWQLFTNVVIEKLVAAKWEIDKLHLSAKAEQAVFFLLFLMNHNIIIIWVFFFVQFHPAEICSYCLKALLLYKSLHPSVIQHCKTTSTKSVMWHFCFWQRLTPPTSPSSLLMLQVMTERLSVLFELPWCLRGHQIFSHLLR